MDANGWIMAEFTRVTEPHSVFIHSDYPLQGMLYGR